MNFAFTDEQLALAATVRDVLRDHCVPGDRLTGWDELSALGFFTEPGLTLVDLLPALEETGRACLGGPVAETLALSPYLPAKQRISAQLGGYAPDADLADAVVVAADVGLRLVTAPVLSERPSADPGRRLFAVSGSSTSLDAPLGSVIHRATVATAAQLVGVARHLLAVSVEYAKVRKQFGAPIGSFQAIKHQLADVAIAVEFAAPLVAKAALTLTTTPTRTLNPAPADAARTVTPATAEAAHTGGPAPTEASRTDNPATAEASAATAAADGVDIRAAKVAMGEAAADPRAAMPDVDVRLAVADVDIRAVMADVDVSAAKAAAGEAAVLAAGTALQVHGAIGYTHELDLRHWLARAWSLSAAHGSSADHRARIRRSL